MSDLTHEFGFTMQTVKEFRRRTGQITMHSSETATVTRLARAARAFRFPIPLWIIILLLAISAIFYTIILFLFNSSDSSPHRWQRVDATWESPLYRSLVTGTATQLSAVPKSTPFFDWSIPSVVVYSAPAAPSHRSHLTIRGLSDNTQAHVIDFLAKEIPLEPDAWTKLQDALINKPSPAMENDNDPLKFRRTLVATVSKGTAWDPGDRFLWTRVLIAPINFTFAGYTVAATENATVRITSTETTNTRKIAASLGLDIPGVKGAKATLDPDSERTVKTTSDIDSQYERLGVDIFPTFLRIIRESERGGDVLGNTTIVTSMVTDPYMIHKKTFQDHPTPPDPDKLELLVTATHFDEGDTNNPLIAVQPRIPIPHCPLKAVVWMLYEERHIKKGREYYEESKQDAQLIRDARDKQPMEIVDADDVSPAVWSIRIVKHAETEDKSAMPAFLAAHAEKGSLPRNLVFTEYDAASKVVQWLKTGNPQDSRNTLQLIYPGAPNKINEDVSLIPVRQIYDECDPNYQPKYEGSYEPLPRSDKK